MNRFWKYQLFVGHNMMHPSYTLLYCVERAALPSSGSSISYPSSKLQQQVLLFYPSSRKLLLSIFVLNYILLWMVGILFIKTKLFFALSYKFCRCKTFSQRGIDMINYMYYFSTNSIRE
jgi:hypothetical protein